MVNCHMINVLQNRIFCELFSFHTQWRNALFQKNPNREGGCWLHAFLKNPWNFSFFFLTSWNSWQNKAQSWIFHKTELNPLEIPRPKTKAPGNSTLSSLGRPWKFHVVKKEPLPNTKLTTWTVFGLLSSFGLLRVV